MDTRLQDNLNGMQHNYIAPFLWLHGEEDSLILREIDKIYECGIRSICLESRVHEEFCREGWWSDVRQILERCREKGMNVWILDDKRFPSGYANGIFETKYPGKKAFSITETHMDIAGPVENGSVMADAWKSYEDDELVAVAARRHIPDTESYEREVIDLTPCCSDGMVYFSLPEGNWRIYFLMKTRWGTADYYQGFCDMLDRQAVQLYIEEVYESHYTRFREYFGNTFLGFFSDEPCFHNNSRFPGQPLLGEGFIHHPWHTVVYERLQEEYGEEVRKMLLGLWCDIPGVSDRIRYSYMNIITDEYRKNFGCQMGDWCRQHGVRYIGHVIEDNNWHAVTGSGTGHYFRSLEGQDMSGIDVVLHQIVPGLTECSSAGFVNYKHMNQRFFHYVLGKLGSSLAHLDARKKGRALCEIFGAYGWAEGTKIMKYLADHMLVRGINYYVPHAFSPKPEDEDCPPNFYDSGHNPLYKYFSRIMDYLNRASYLLNDGIHVPVCGILYDAEARWGNRDFLPLEDVAKVLLDHQLDYDIIPADALDQMDENGVINGEKYPLLLVPFCEGLPDTILEKLHRLPVKVAVVGKDVQGNRNPLSRTEWKGFADGTREMVSLKELPEYIRRTVGADVEADSQSRFLRYYHYTRDGADLYLFANEDIRNRLQTQVTLSAFSGGKYILYDAFENKACPAYSADGKVLLDLPPYHTVFVLCNEISEQTLSGQGIRADRLWEDSRITVLEETRPEPVFRISTATEPENRYEEYRITDKLFNITAAGEKPYFSGNIRYESTLEIQEDGRYLLDLGKVGEAVSLYINGKCAGSKIVPPYVFDISDYVTRGANSICIIVSNHNGYKKRDRFSKFLLFEASGLLGPVTLKRYTDKKQ